MSVELKNNKFLTYLVVLITLFILVLFTSKQFSQMQVNSDMIYQKQQEITEARQAQEKLQQIKNDVSQSGASVERYMNDFSENEILDYLYMYQETVNTESTKMVINAIQLTESEENEFGFYQKSVIIDAIVADSETMKAFLSYLVAEDAKYRFFVEDFYYPNDGREGSFNISVPLKIFYR
jgi:uncharacterized protein YpmS